MYLKLLGNQIATITSKATARIRFKSGILLPLKLPNIGKKLKEKLAQSISSHIQDYRIEDGVQITPERVLAWADQFGEESEFILSELHHILPRMYVSRDQAKTFVKEHIEWLKNKFGYHDVNQLLIESEFLTLQGKDKSQRAILDLLEEVLMDSWQSSYKPYVTYPKKNFIYFDDVLATGSTLGRHIEDWLKMPNGESRNADLVLTGQYRLSINLFCLHKWGHSFQDYRIRKVLSDGVAGKISWMWNLLVENHARFQRQSHNHAFPLKNQPANIHSYLANLNAEKYENYAFRDENNPAHEVFFSSKENRVRYENVILQKGLSIISQIRGEIKPNVRPLGLINPTYKTFGLGTHFVTWRNIPNNCPLVYWWEVPTHDWLPLFPRKVVT